MILNAPEPPISHNSKTGMYWPFFLLSNMYMCNHRFFFPDDFGVFPQTCGTNTNKLN